MLIPLSEWTPRLHSQLYDSKVAGLWSANFVQLDVSFDGYDLDVTCFSAESDPLLHHCCIYNFHATFEG